MAAQSRVATNITMVAGGWSHPKHFRAFAKKLRQNNLSLDVVTKPQQDLAALAVLTHSVGALDDWERISSQHYFFLGPNFTQQSLSRRAVLRKLHRNHQQHMTYLRRQKRLRDWARTYRLGAMSVVRHPRRPGYQYQRLKANDFVSRVKTFAANHPKANLTVISYHGDTWTETELLPLFDKLPNVRAITLNAPHDDIIYNPDYYVAMVKELV
jgi:hypothetical protein